jgi:HD superfamily phosphodiesterase
MITAQLSLDDIAQLTLKVGESWAIAHARRLIKLAKEISVDLPYDAQIIEFAAYLHDWGAFPCYLQKGVEHALRSRQIVETEILPKLDISTSAGQVLLEAIEFHDYRDMRPPRSTEALLLREADMLEFLGMLGMALEFTRGPKDIEVCYRRILERRGGIQERFSLPRAQEIAQARLVHMQQCLNWLEEESLGVM